MNSEAMIDPESTLNKTPDEWYETVGKEHLKRFCNLIRYSAAIGREYGYEPNQMDMNQMVRLYRNDSFWNGGSEN